MYNFGRASVKNNTDPLSGNCETPPSPHARQYIQDPSSEPLSIDTLLNLLFRCSHRRLTRPVAPITKAGQPHSQSYVVCLDCGKQFEYDLNEMRIGKAIEPRMTPGWCPQPADPRETKIKYALMAAVPAAVVLGAVLKGKGKAAKPDTGKADPAARHEPDRREE